MNIEIKRKFIKEQLKINVSQNNAAYFTFPAIEDIPGFKHVMTTRLGGVSKGPFASMNFSLRDGDDKDNVAENFKKIADILGTDCSHIATTKQTHTANVRVVSKEDGGKGIIKERDYTDTDALITNERGLALSAFSADCVPVMFIDPVKRAIGIAHSGWKGTAGLICENVIKAMGQNYGSAPEDIITGIGPCICRDCYEIGPEVAARFMNAPFGDVPDNDLLKISPPKAKKPGREYVNPVLTRKTDTDEEKYLLDLWEANKIILIYSGIKPENIHITDVCTKCNPKLLFSYRHQKIPVGNNGMFLIIE